LSDVLGEARVGVSTGFLRTIGDWDRVVVEALRFPQAVELSALALSELPGLLGYLEGHRPPFDYVAVHGPAKGLSDDDDSLVDALSDIPALVQAIVMHPDVMVRIDPYARLGRRLVVENMDRRKRGGRTVPELQPYFDACPEAGFCFDIAHAASVDPTMTLANELLDAFESRLRHVHISSLDASDRHVTLTYADEARFAPVLLRCLHVPWILESRPPETWEQISSVSPRRRAATSSSS
jgi:hypothetical protein